MLRQGRLFLVWLRASALFPNRPPPFTPQPPPPQFYRHTFEVGLGACVSIQTGRLQSPNETLRSSKAPSQCTITTQIAILIKVAAQRYLVTAQRGAKETGLKGHPRPGCFIAAWCSEAKVRRHARSAVDNASCKALASLRFRGGGAGVGQKVPGLPRSSLNPFCCGGAAVPASASRFPECCEAACER